MKKKVIGVVIGTYFLGIWAGIYEYHKDYDDCLKMIVSKNDVINF
jgi:hypothetical protein